MEKVFAPAFDGDASRLVLQHLFGLRMDSSSKEPVVGSSVAANLPLATQVAGVFGDEDKSRLTFKTIGGPDLRIDSEYAYDPDYEVLSRIDTVTNSSPATVELTRSLSMFKFAQSDYELYVENSDWCHENQGEWIEAPKHEMILSHKGGRTTQGGTPALALRDKNTGNGLVFHIVPLGDWIIKIVPDHSTGALTLLMGLSDKSLEINLKLGDSLRTPEILIQPIRRDFGLEDAAAAFQVHSKKRFTRKLQTPPPVSYNTWFDWFDNLDPHRLETQMRAAKELGCEVFVVDAGWYGGDDAPWPTQTGDWRENRKKAFKGKMVEFADTVRANGLKFGLWMEPERFCAEVPIRKMRPECFKSGENGHYYPDLTIPAAYDYVKSEILRLIESYQLAWMKIDFNFSFETDASKQAFRQYYTRWFALLDEVKSLHPEVFFEGCDSGGMRLDLNVLSHFDGHFLSDNINPWGTLRITQGAARRLPMGRIIRWIGVRGISSDIPLYGDSITFTPRIIAPSGTGATWNEFESVDLDFLALSVLLGIPSFTGDIASLAASQKKRLAEYVVLYKKRRKTSAESILAPLTPIRPINDRTGWIVFQTLDDSENANVIYFFRLDDETETMTVKLKRECEWINEMNASIIGSEGCEIIGVSQNAEVTVRLPRKHTACAVFAQ